MSLGSPLWLPAWPLRHLVCCPLRTAIRNANNCLWTFPVSCTLSSSPSNIPIKLLLKITQFYGWGYKLRPAEVRELTSPPRQRASQQPLQLGSDIPLCCLLDVWSFPYSIEWRAGWPWVPGPREWRFPSIHYGNTSELASGNSCQHLWMNLYLPLPPLPGSDFRVRQPNSWLAAR
jgi:hypothetical protein